METTQRMQDAAELEQFILRQLRSHAWPPGHKLPPERLLSADSGLSRSTVRRVLTRLKQKGLITQAVGSGTYVSEQVGEVFLALARAHPRHSPSPAEILAARLSLEPAMLGLVVGNATHADFERMERCCDAAEAATTLEEFEKWDGALHEAIADAAHNAMITQVSQVMGHARTENEWGALKRRSFTPERRAAYEQEHRALVAALRERDLPAAQRICTDHLLHVRRNMIEY